MTRTELIFSRMAVKPRSTLLIGGRSDEEFISTYFPKTREILVSDLASKNLDNIGQFAAKSPSGEYRIVCLKNICRFRKDSQAVLLKLIEESSDKTYWVLSALDQNAVLAPIISRSFLLEWVSNSEKTMIFTELLKDLIKNKSYLDIFKLHEKIIKDSEKSLDRTKEMHLTCLDELIYLLPVHKSAKIHKIRKDLSLQLRTEIGFKSALIEAIT